MKLNFKEGRGDKIHISVDGEYRFTVDKAYFVLLDIFQGKEADEEEVSELQEKIENRRAYNQAVSYLSRRDHTEKELLVKLRQKGYTESGERAVEKLKRDGYIDDERFAVMYVKELVSLKKYGKKRIEQELYRKGVSREIIGLVLENADFDDNTLDDIIRRKYLRYLNDEKGVKKAVAGLLRMGYSYSEIKAALGRLADDENIYEVSDD